MLTMVEYVHQRLMSYPAAQIGVDMTMGNGYDTLALAKHCQEVYAFDIQEEALIKTKALLGDIENVHLILDGHQHIDHYINTFDYAIFNLGYLPLSDHHVTTVLTSTQIAIQKAIHMVNIALWIVVYPGHPQGYEESLWINDYVKQLDTHRWNVSCYCMMNKKQAPYVIEIEKRKTKNQR